MIIALLIIGCGGGNGFSGGFPTKLNENSTMLNDNATMLDDNATNLNDNATAINDAPLLEDYMEVYVDYNKVRLFWKSASDSDGEIESYLISYKQNDAAWSSEYTNALENYTLFLEYDQRYQFRVRAKDNQGAYSAYIYSEVVTIGSQSSVQKNREEHPYRSLDRSGSVDVIILHPEQKVSGILQELERGAYYIQIALNSMDWIDNRQGILLAHHASKVEYFANTKLFVVYVEDNESKRMDQARQLDRIVEDIQSVSAREVVNFIDYRSNQLFYYDFGFSKQGDLIDQILPILSLD